MQHGFSMPLVFGVTRAHCVAFAERAPVNAGSWGMAPGRRWGALDEPVHPRSHEPRQACPARYLSPAGCQHPTLEGGRVTDLLLATRELAEYLGCRGRRCCGGRAGVTLLDQSVLRGRSAGLPTRRRILRLRRAGSRTLPPRKVGSTRRARVARFRRGRRSETRPSPGRARRYSSRIRRNTTPPHPSSRRAPRHAMPNLTLNGGSVQVARL